MTLRHLGWVLLVASCAIAEEGPRPTTKIKYALVVAPARVGPRQRAGLLSVVSEQTQKSVWGKRRIEKGDTVYDVIRRKYGLQVTNRADYAEAKATYDAIAKANNLDRNGAIEVGEELFMPPLPVRTKDPTSPEPEESPAQIIDLKQGEVYVTDLHKCPLSLYSEVCRLPGFKASASSPWVLEGDNDQLELAAAFLQNSERDYVLMPQPPDDSIRLEVGGLLRASLQAQAEPPAPKTPALPNLAALNPSAQDELFLLDFFDAPAQCTHGRRVEDVARQVLEQLGAVQFAAKIKPIELAFYPHNPDALARLDRFIATFREEVQRVLRRYRQALVEQYKNNTDPHIVPVIYLVALYDELIQTRDAPIISTSFYTTADPFKVFPNSYKPNSPAVMVSAALNIPSVIEDTSYEPQKTFWQLRRDYGVLLVGGTDQSGSAFGMTSTQGAGLTCLARGVGYKGRCITEGDMGASYATPAIATMLLVARAYWRKNNERITGVEAKRRLLLASRPDARFPQSAAMGTPRLDRLLLKQGTWAFSTDDDAMSLPQLRGSITYRTADGEISMRPFRRGDIAGVEFGQQRDFLFFDDTTRWVPAEVVSTNLTFSKDGVAVPFKRSDFPHLEALVRHD